MTLLEFSYNFVFNFTTKLNAKIFLKFIRNLWKTTMFRRYFIIHHLYQTNFLDYNEP